MTQISAPDGSPASALSFGTMQFGGTADESASREMFDTCRAAGINAFDTAHVYNGGASETILGRLAAAERERLILASKVSFRRGGSVAGIRESFDDSRRRLNIDTIDLYYLHRWDAETPLEATFEALAELRRTGGIRHVGVSNFAAWQVVKAQNVARGFDLTIDAIQPMYSLVKRQAEVEILPMAASEKIDVMAYSPLGGGLLSGKYAEGGTGRLSTEARSAARYGPEWMHRAAERLALLARENGIPAATLAVAWVMRHPAVSSPIISARNSEQLAPSLAAADYSMDDGLYARLSALTPTPPPATDRLEEAA